MSARGNPWVQAQCVPIDSALHDWPSTKPKGGVIYSAWRIVFSTPGVIEQSG